MRIDWTDEQRNRVIELRKTNHTWQEISERMTKEYGENFTVESCRNQWRNRNNKKRKSTPNKTTSSKNKFKTNVQHNHEKGIVHIHKIIQANSEDQLMDEEYVLKQVGFCPKTWTIAKLEYGHWEHLNKKMAEPKTLYASKLILKRREVEEQSIKELIEHIQKIKPIKVVVPKYKVKDKRLLEIPLFDQHFGVSDYEYYKDTQSKINHLITSRVWEEILITIGSDMLHHNDMSNRTASGREIQHTDMTKAWDDARKFYKPLIKKALLQSNNVKIIYKRGNHDESLSWAFVQMLKAKYPQVEYDDGFEERKAHTFGKVFIGFTHGDKGRRKLHNLFPVEFPNEWANAKVREVHTGHFHREDGIDEFGTMVRTLATRNKTDKWHKENGYVGAHKRFMVFEYSKDELESIHYV